MMDFLDATTLLYLSKNWDGQGTLLEYAQKFQQTRDELGKLLKEEQSKSLKQALESGTFSF